MNSNIIFGAYDPIYPAGILSAAPADNLFGIRLLTINPETHEIADGKTLDFHSLRVGPIFSDLYFHVEWILGGKKACLTWGRTDERTVYGKVEFEEGLQILLEQYLPREYRLKNRWVNFCRLASNIFTGEMISPYDPEGIDNAMRLMVDSEPDSTTGYNQRTQQLDDVLKTGQLRNIKEPNIWNDMGLSWYQGLIYSHSFSFEYKIGQAKDFLNLQDNGNSASLIASGYQQVEKNRISQQEKMPVGIGKLREIPEVLQSAIYFNTMYREDTNRRFIMVDRPWIRNNDGWGIAFNWDTFLSSLSAMWFDETLAKENMLSGLDLQLPDGRIPLLTHQQQGHTSEPPITAGRCQHLVHGLTIWQVYLRTLDKSWLRQCYDKLCKLHAWWFADRGDGQPYRDGINKGLLTFGYDPEKEMGVLGATVSPYVAKAQYAYFETYDDSPQWTNGEYFKSVKNMKDVREEDVDDTAKYLDKTHTANIYTLERCCLYAAEAEALALMAKELDLSEDEEKYTAQHQKMAERVNQTMWNEQEGCYYNYHFDGHQLKIQTPDCFMPIMAGIANKEQTERLMKILLDENKFWGQWKMPSVAYDEPSYQDQAYWRGQIWPPMVLWTYFSLRRAGKKKEAWELAQNASGMLLREWQEKGFYPENYNANTGRCSGSPHYNWGTLMGMIALYEMVQLTPETIVFGDNAAPDGTGIKQLILDGQCYSVVKENGNTVVTKNGVEIARRPGAVTINRG